MATRTRRPCNPLDLFVFWFTFAFAFAFVLVLVLMYGFRTTARDCCRGTVTVPLLTPSPWRIIDIGIDIDIGVDCSRDLFRLWDDDEDGDLTFTFTLTEEDTGSCDKTVERQRDRHNCVLPVPASPDSSVIPLLFRTSHSCDGDCACACACACACDWLFVCWLFVRRRDTLGGAAG